MVRRGAIAGRICQLAGGDVVRVIDFANGWPAYVEVHCSDAWRKFALFAAPVGRSNRDRDEVERRFQNPGSNRPMVWSPDSTPLFLGLWDEGSEPAVSTPVLVSADVQGRASNDTRFSVFPKLSSLLEATANGWAASLHLSDEHMTYFWPPFLNVVATARYESVSISDQDMRRALDAAGLSENADADGPVDRARRAAEILVREAKFRKNVLDAYGGLCALCGLGVGLVEAAHIYPASAPGSRDVVSNGVALCRNHHGAFDRYLIWVDPNTLVTKIHPSLYERAQSDQATARFVENTKGVLHSPDLVAHRPDPSMFDRRYSGFASEYRWAK